MQLPNEVLLLVFQSSDPTIWPILRLLSRDWRAEIDNFDHKIMFNSFLIRNVLKVKETEKSFVLGRYHIRKSEVNVNGPICEGLAIAVMVRRSIPATNQVKRCLAQYIFNIYPRALTHLRCKHLANIFGTINVPRGVDRNKQYVGLCIGMLR